MTDKSYRFPITNSSYDKHQHLIGKYAVKINYYDDNNRGMIDVALTFKQFRCINQELKDEKIEIGGYVAIILDNLYTQDDDMIAWFMRIYRIEIEIWLSHIFVFGHDVTDGETNQFSYILKLSTKYNYCLDVLRSIKRNSPVEKFIQVSFFDVILENSKEDSLLELIIEIFQCTDDERIYAIDARSIVKHGVKNKHYKCLKFIYENLFSTIESNFLVELNEDLLVRSIYHDCIDFYEKICKTPITALTSYSNAILADILEMHMNVEVFVNFCYRLFSQDSVDISCIVEDLIEHILDQSNCRMSDYSEIFVFIATLYPNETEKVFIDQMIYRHRTHAISTVMKLNNDDKDKVIDFIVKANRLNDNINLIVKIEVLPDIFYQVFFEIRRDKRELIKMEL